MTDKTQILKTFQEKADKLLDSMSSFKPSIDAIEELAVEGLNDSGKQVLDQFKKESSNIKTPSELIALRDNYLQKLEDARK